MKSKNQQWNERIWPLIHQYSLAIKNGCWLEVIDLLYYLIVFELRSLLTMSNIGNNRQALSPNVVEEKDYLFKLATLAWKKRFITDFQLKQEIDNFNSKRGKAIHKMLEGKIFYEELRNIYEQYHDLPGKIQSLFLKIKIGSVENNPILR